ncbi:hypothetical protein BJV82DRAFT_610732 [Fennellomyces sp. T-0311]|nr:hypothetical protein BJV82DRAFT_610732 [Fennellomyces sp. T-0311]
MAALVEAFANLYPNTMVKTTTPTNCRPVSPQVARDEMGNFFGAYTHTWTKSDVKFWDRAKIYGQLLKANKTQAAKVAGQLSYFSKYPEDYCDFWYGHLENPMGRSGGIELSDLGRVVLNKSWQIQSLWFCQSAQVFTSPLSINTISTQDTMYASIGWQRGSLDESKADALGPLLLETLKNYIHDY